MVKKAVEDEIVVLVDADAIARNTKGDSSIFTRLLDGLNEHLEEQEKRRKKLFYIYASSFAIAFSLLSLAGAAVLFSRNSKTSDTIASVRTGEKLPEESAGLLHGTAISLSRPTVKQATTVVTIIDVKPQTTTVLTPNAGGGEGYTLATTTPATPNHSLDNTTPDTTSDTTSNTTPDTTPTQLPTQPLTQPPTQPTTPSPTPSPTVARRTPPVVATHAPTTTTSTTTTTTTQTTTTTSTTTTKPTVPTTTLPMAQLRRLKVTEPPRGSCRMRGYGNQVSSTYKYGRIGSGRDTNLKEAVFVDMRYHFRTDGTIRTINVETNNPDGKRSFSVGLFRAGRKACEFRLREKHTLPPIPATATGMFAYSGLNIPVKANEHFGIMLKDKQGGVLLHKRDFNRQNFCYGDKVPQGKKKVRMRYHSTYSDRKFELQPFSCELLTSAVAISIVPQLTYEIEPYKVQVVYSKPGWIFFRNGWYR